MNKVETTTKIIDVIGKILLAAMLAAIVWLTIRYVKPWVKQQEYRFVIEQLKDNNP